MDEIRRVVDDIANSVNDWGDSVWATIQEWGMAILLLGGFACVVMLILVLMAVVSD